MLVLSYWEHRMVANTKCFQNTAKQVVFFWLSQASECNLTDLMTFRVLEQ